jgi:hypothetical protein
MAFTSKKGQQITARLVGVAAAPPGTSAGHHRRDHWKRRLAAIDQMCPRD